MALERAAIVAAALDLLNETGLDGLTMRKLATALDVQAPSLYWHFPGKPALLDAMANALLEDVARAPTPSGDLHTVLRDCAEQFRRALQARRDGARVYAGTFVMGENVLRLAEAMIGALLRAGVDPRSSMRSAFSLIYYVLGFVIEEQAWQTQSGLDPKQLSAALAQWAGRFPAVEAVLPHFSSDDQDGRFAHGLELFLAGLQRDKPVEFNSIAAFKQAFDATR